MPKSKKFIKSKQAEQIRSATVWVNCHAVELRDLNTAILKYSADAMHEMHGSTLAAGTVYVQISDMLENVRVMKIRAESIDNNLRVILKNVKEWEEGVLKKPNKVRKG